MDWGKGIGGRVLVTAKRFVVCETGTISPRDGSGWKVCEEKTAGEHRDIVRAYIARERASRQPGFGGTIAPSLIEATDLNLP